MISETLLEKKRIRRKSDSGVYIRNTVTGELYAEALDLTNEERERRGLVPYDYEETTQKVAELPHRDNN